MNEAYLNKYLERIRLQGKLAPKLNTLCSLQKNHLLNIPFENLDIHHGIPIKID
ncbi:MAG: arylamine N-acetyltransferase [Melioribacteraceae bacterium]|nr:arylamine N-acetyltransferase [Melioribacteraceae bacterium]